jgi:hypothetical protein
MMQLRSFACRAADIDEDEEFEKHDLTIMLENGVVQDALVYSPYGWLLFAAGQLGGLSLGGRTWATAAPSLVIVVLLLHISMNVAGYVLFQRLHISLVGMVVSEV